jgi:uncharacterized ferritin-like protein (DUF455 family)
MSAALEISTPPTGTLERWCFDFICTTDLAAKLAPPSTDGLAFASDAPERRIAVPGRPTELVVVERSPSAPRAGALVSPEARARLLHTFVHHELQAAELFAWAILAFPRTPQAFRTGLLALCREELEHMQLYLAHMRALGTEFGAHPVRDWFWERVALCETPAAFVALQGLGLEGANLDHCPRFAAQFRTVGDEAGARILERVQEEEIGHVAFAARWFEHFSGAPLDYDRWRAALPAPLTPALLQGRPLDLAARRRAGLDETFLARLAAEPPVDPRRRS